MNLMEIIYPIATIGTMSVLFGIGLGLADKKFAVPVDERVDLLKEHLPGANCGGCGFAGCDAFAQAIVSGEAKVNGCPVSNEVQKTAMAEVMGQTVEAGVANIAFVKCHGTNSIAKMKYDYQGVKTCTDAQLVHGGPKGCSYGCLGFGTCEKACPFDAIKMVDGIAVVEPEQCKGCSACVAVCPRKLIYIGSKDSQYQVKCASKDKGKDVKANCTQGCIGCGICVKQCEFEAITVTDQCATIDAKKCTGCGKCAAKCPTKAIELL